jgi:hypothetical protein
MVFLPGTFIAACCPRLSNRVLWDWLPFPDILCDSYYGLWVRRPFALSKEQLLVVLGRYRTCYRCSPSRLYYVTIVWRWHVSVVAKKANLIHRWCEKFHIKSTSFTLKRVIEQEYKETWDRLFISNWIRDAEYEFHYTCLNNTTISHKVIIPCRSLIVYQEYMNRVHGILRATTNGNIRLVEPSLK